MGSLIEETGGRIYDEGRIYGDEEAGETSVGETKKVCITIPNSYRLEEIPSGISSGIPSGIQSSTPIIEIDGTKINTEEIKEVLRDPEIMKLATKVGLEATATTLGVGMKKFKESGEKGISSMKSFFRNLFEKKHQEKTQQSSGERPTYISGIGKPAYDIPSSTKISDAFKIAESKTQENLKKVI